MKILVLALVILAAVALIVRVVKFGGVGAAFSRSLKEDRKVLSIARSRVRGLEAERTRELAQAGDAVSALQALVASLESPGVGRHVASVGPVALHEHALTVNGTSVPLLGLTVRSDSARDSTHLYIGTPEGFVLQHAFSTAWTGTGKMRTSRQEVAGDMELVTVNEKMRREHSDEQVRALATAIHNQIQLEARFVQERPTLLQQACVDLEAATRHQARVASDSQILRDLAAARATLVQVEADWESRTTSAPAPGSQALPESQ